MPPRRASCLPPSRLRSTTHPLALSVAALALSAFATAQQSTPPRKPQPPTVEAAPWIILDSVVTEHWPASLSSVNAPADVRLLNPGQCIRPAALASGDSHTYLLAHATIGWSIKLAEKQETFPAEPITASKDVKPEGMDFVNGALAAANIKSPQLSTFVTMAVGASRWCVPQGAADGTVELRATIHRGAVESVLQPVTVQIESLQTGEAKTFKDQKELNDFLSAYDAHPEPARLLPGFQFLVASKGDSLIPFAFFRAAFAHDAPTVQGFGPGLAASPKLAEILALNLLAKAGVTLSTPPTLTDQEKKDIAEAADLPDAHDMKPTEELFTKLDFLWAEFLGSGRKEPVRLITTALAWRSDYEAFDAMRKSGKKPGKMTESTIRGVTYMAAGWSLRSFQHNDPLAADYLDAILADPATSAAIKTELRGLGTNPAFDRN